MAGIVQQGWNEQTPAARTILGQGGVTRSASSRRRKRSSKRSKSTARRKPAKRRASGSGAKSAARLVKGSAAAKAWMAKIRRKRKK